MSLWENFHLAISSLLANKMRALLTMLGIIIGIASVIGILTIGDSLSGSINENIQSLGARNITVVLQPRESGSGEQAMMMALSGRNRLIADKT
jgi:putative ABC transport system permease protein